MLVRDLEPAPRAGSARPSSTVFFVLLLVLLVSVSASAQTPPEAPVINEPEFDGQVVNPSDVHMEVSPMVDADGDDHLCSDFEIWSVSPSERAWVTACIGGVERLHTHLGDGVFENSHGDLSELLYDTDYELRVRFQDSSGMWGAWGVRPFSTADPTAVFGFELNDVLATPEPKLVDATGNPFLLPEGDPGTAIVLGAGDGQVFLDLRGAPGDSNAVIDFAPRTEHAFLRVVLQGGSSGASLPDLDLTFTDDDNTLVTVYLPAAALAPFASRTLWVSASGATFEGNASPDVPDFGVLARGAPVPWRSVMAGFETEIVASGFALPVNIAFVPDPGTAGEDPYFYVTELYGAIKVVTRDFTVSDYATGLLNFDPTGNFPGSGEQGLAGIAVDAATGDVFAGVLYDSAPPNGAHYPKVIRLRSSDGGATADSIETILDMPGETQGQSHFISNVSIGPDGKLYVHMGDGFTASTALDLDSFRGKILRLELDGSACTDNPFYDEGDGINARDYVYAYGLRNPFGGAWRALDGTHYEVENGPSSNDRFARVLPGDSFGWDGTNTSMTIGATYVWTQTHAPVNIAFVEPETFDSSGLPSRFWNQAFVTESGPTWATGPQTRGKRIVMFELDDQGSYLSGPSTVVEYSGQGKSTAVGLAAGPDGLYFTDLYKDMDYTTPIDAGANVLRVKWVGRADFSISDRVGSPPFTVRFVDKSEIPGAYAFRWILSDGTEVTSRDLTHTFNAPGAYDVRLEVSGPSGVIVQQRNGAVLVTENTEGLLAELFDNRSLEGSSTSRLDPNIDFQWGQGSPDPALGTDDFSIRWTGRINIPSTDEWTFITRTDDGVRLWIDDVPWIDEWRNQAPTDHSASDSLQAGVHEIRMEYYERGGGAMAQLSWESSTVAKEIVPPSAFDAAGIPISTDVPSTRRHGDVTLHGNRPNPFNPRTEIAFSTTSAGRATVEVFDLRGRRVAVVLDRKQIEAGEHFAWFDGKDRDGRALASGAYVYRLRFDRGAGLPLQERAGRMVLVK